MTAQSGLNLRAGAGAEYDILKTLPYGSTIYVLEKGDVWSRVNAGGTTGYVSSSYFEMK